MHHISPKEVGHCFDGALEEYAKARLDVWYTTSQSSYAASCLSHLVFKRSAAKSGDPTGVPKSLKPSVNSTGIVFVRSMESFHGEFSDG